MHYVHGFSITMVIDSSPLCRLEYPTYLGDRIAGLSWSSLEIYSWLIYAPPLLHAFVHFFLLPICKLCISRIWLLAAHQRGPDSSCLRMLGCVCSTHSFYQLVSCTLWLRRDALFDFLISMASNHSRSRNWWQNLHILKNITQTGHKWIQCLWD